MPRYIDMSSIGHEQANEEQTSDQPGHSMKEPLVPENALRDAEDEEEVDDGIDTDSDSDIPNSHGPKTNSEKRKVQNTVMRHFIANISSRLTQKEVEEAASKSVSEEQLSIQDILAAQDTSVPIVNPRDYQTELFQRAKSENIIAVLDTGSGKTHIATLLLRHILDEELENRAKGNKPKIAFFLVREQIISLYLCSLCKGRFCESCIPTRKRFTMWSRPKSRRYLWCHGSFSLGQVDVAKAF